MKNLEKDVKKMSGEFTTVNTQLQNLKQDESDLSDSEDEYEASYFQMAEINFGQSDFHFAGLDKKINPVLQVFSARLPVVTSS